VTGAEVNREEIAAYLEKTFARLKRLGAKKVVFGSAPARALDENTTEEMGYAQMAELCREVIVPACEKYDVTVVIEPLRASACNFIHTLADVARVVEAVGSPYVRLLGDTIHMNSNSDNPEDVVKYRDILHHFHIAELGRVLPEEEYSDYTRTVIERLRGIGYDGTISFETKNGEGLASMKRALALLKSNF
jgi:sugar phosphate isomerase/epimerase